MSPHREPYNEEEPSETVFPTSWHGLKQQIIYLAQFGSSVQVIHGEAGAGKTRFFSRLLSSDVGASLAGVQVQEGEGGRLESFLLAVLQGAGLRPNQTASLGELVVGLRGLAQTLRKERSRMVLLVDDAHHFTDAELGALLSILQGNPDAGVGLHVVFFALPGFATRLDELQVLDVTVHDASLPAFTLPEMQQFLKVCPDLPQSLLESLEQVERIWEQSGGLPGPALAIAQDLSEETTKASLLSLKGLPLPHLAAVGILCGILIWAFLVRGSESLLQDGAVQKPVEVPIVRVKEMQPQPDAIKPTASPQLSNAESTDSIEKTPTKSPVIEQAATPIQPTLAPEKEIGPNLDQSPPESKLVQASAPAQVTHKTVTEAVQKTEAVKKTEVVQKKAPESFSDLIKRGHSQLLSYPGNAFALQLMASADQEKLAQFIAEQPNKANLLVYRTSRDGKALFILIEGYYADRASALAAIANLPPQQRNGGPWPKSVSQIQQEIRQVR